MTPLGAEIAALIRQNGPIGVDRYMALCLGHPVHGYYRTRDPLGAQGDFTTAPEISQMFGELLGAWTAYVRGSIGGAGSAPPGWSWGPAAGTLMADALRALRAALPGVR
ncbi:methyltransferase, partial [Methylobacterium radiotolerans]